jgi:two-component system, sensor histidine kinase RegB
LGAEAVPTLSIDPVAAARGRAADPIGLAWLVTGRWTTLAAAIGAVVAGQRAAEAQLTPAEATVAVLAILLSNLWLWWRVRSARPTSATMAGALVCADVLLLSWILLECGGVLNPASVFYLVQIVLVALVLGRTWTWIVTALSVTGYAALFLTPTDALRAAQGMHPEIALHMQGMWIAFAMTALIIAVLVTRLAISVERRDRALEVLRERGMRASRVAGLATVVAGAAHELSTPLGTIAVAARELERAIAQRGGDADLAGDARLIRVEIDRCRSILNQMAGRIAEPMGESPRPIDEAIGLLGAGERARIQTASVPELPVVWPGGVVSQALGNLLRNALQASERDAVQIGASRLADGRIQLIVVDRGRGMTPDELSRAGEPFFTTKPPGSGTGLGVFVTRSAMEQLGGELALSSTLGAGTSATITLPDSVVSRGEATHE